MGEVVVVKVGTSSLTGPSGALNDEAFAKIAHEIANLWQRGTRIVLVTSGAIAAGLAHLGMERPAESTILQAISAVGQQRLMGAWDRALGDAGLLAGQVLLAPLDFGHRRQYLHARGTITRLMELGVVPVVNENDAVADDEIRFGDNDRLAALVSQLVHASLLVLLTDAPGLLEADPRLVPEAPLVEEVAEADHLLAVSLAGGPGTDRGSGGMASKVAAARMASWSGVRTVIAAADRSEVITHAIDGVAGVGTTFASRPRRMAARKLWIAFALPPRGKIVVDHGAREAVVNKGRSLLPAGIVAVEGVFMAEDAVELADPHGEVFAKGLARHKSVEVAQWAGVKTSHLPAHVDPEVVHRDDLVVLL